jgi:APA family basic amino acid/polyamine antiporter
MALRKRSPELPRPFRAPLMPVTAILGILISLAMMLGLPGDTWLRLVIWLLAGLVIYFLYSRKHSKVQITWQLAEGIEEQMGRSTIPIHKDDRNDPSS